MAEDTKPAVVPVVIDAATFDPAPGNTFSYKGQNYKAFNLLQVRRGTRNKFVRIDEHLKACESVDAQAELLVGIISEFAPGVPREALLDEPLEMLLAATVSLGNAIGSDGAERPTTGQ